LHCILLCILIFTKGFKLIWIMIFIRSGCFFELDYFFLCSHVTRPFLACIFLEFWLFNSRFSSLMPWLSCFFGVCFHSHFHNLLDFVGFVNFVFASSKNYISHMWLSLLIHNLVKVKWVWLKCLSSSQFLTWFFLIWLVAYYIYILPSLDRAIKVQGLFSRQLRLLPLHHIHW